MIDYLRWAWAVIKAAFTKPENRLEGSLQFIPCAIVVLMFLAVLVIVGVLIGVGYVVLNVIPH